MLFIALDIAVVMVMCCGIWDVKEENGKNNNNILLINLCISLSDSRQQYNNNKVQEITKKTVSQPANIRWRYKKVRIRNERNNLSEEYDETLEENRMKYTFVLLIRNSELYFQVHNIPENYLPGERATEDGRVDKSGLANVTIEVIILYMNFIYSLFYGCVFGRCRSAVLSCPMSCTGTPCAVQRILRGLR